jgi:hypothetical protein
VVERARRVDVVDREGEVEGDGHAAMLSRPEGRSYMPSATVGPVSGWPLP